MKIFFYFSASFLWRKAFAARRKPVSIMVLAAMLLASFGVRPQNDCQKPRSCQLRGDNHIIARSHGPACLEAINAGQHCQAGHSYCAGPSPMHKVDCLVEAGSFRVGGKIGPAQFHHVAGAGFLARRGQARGIFKARLRKARAAGLFLFMALTNLRQSSLCLRQPPWPRHCR